MFTKTGSLTKKPCGTSRLSLTSIIKKIISIKNIMVSFCMDYILLCTLMAKAKNFCYILPTVTRCNLSLHDGSITLVFKQWHPITSTSIARIRISDG